MFAVQGIAACTALAQSGVSYIVMAARVQVCFVVTVHLMPLECVHLQEACLAAVSAATASTDDKPAAPLPSGMASAAAAALAPLPKAERDLTWTVAVATLVDRVAIGVLQEMAVTQTAVDDNSDVKSFDALTTACQDNAFLSDSLKVGSTLVSQR
jgi:hypothetical protein